MRTAVAETSIHAFDAIKASGTSTHQCARILDHIRQHGDCSIGEIAYALHMEKSTVSARVYSLLYESHNPQLEAKPNRKDRRSGVMVRPVGFPVVGQQDLFMTAQAAQPGHADIRPAGTPSPYSGELRGECNAN